MKRKIIIAIILTLVFSIASFTGCNSEKDEGKEAAMRQIGEVERGDLIISVTADGTLDMPHQVKLRFGTPGTVREIMVDEGDIVREGTLLAKLDDTAQKLAIASAQYDIELAMNELVQKIPISVMGYPNFYPDTTALLRLEQAQEEMELAQELLAQNDYQDAMSELRLAQHDLKATYYMLNVPELVANSIEYDELSNPVQKYPNIAKAVELLEQDQKTLDEVQMLAEQGNYKEAATKLDTTQRSIEETHRLVKRISGKVSVSQRIGACCWQAAKRGTGSTGLMTLSHPDISTSLDWLKQVEKELQNIEELMGQEDYDEFELAELLRMAQHDIEMSHVILEDNELIFRHGLDLSVSRRYNLNLQKAEGALKNTKEELMKTEILSPFDGTVVDIGVKKNDQLSSFDYSSITAIHLVDTKTVEMNGVIDEIDIYQVKVGQEAVIVVDALPNEDLKGVVTFISPFGTQETGVVEFAITIALEPSEVDLRGGLTATADIIVERHENALLLPSGAVKGSADDYWVEVVIDETAGEPIETVETHVVLGIQNGQYTEVISGLEGGERVIVEEIRRK